MYVNYPLKPYIIIMCIIDSLLKLRLLVILYYNILKNLLNLDEKGKKRVVL
jgi:hypothetical protein